MFDSLTLTLTIVALDTGGDLDAYRKLFGIIEGTYILCGGPSDPQFFFVKVGSNPYST